MSDDEYEAELLEILIESTGSEAALKALTVEPLPDEPFDWTGIDDKVRPVVGDVLHLCDGACDALLDVECRTACRRLLAKAARGGPAVFVRKARPQTAAAAIVWLIAKNNALLMMTSLEAKTVAAQFGLSAVSSQRAHTLAAAAGYQPNEFTPGAIYLRDPGLLVSAHRQRLLAVRELLDSDG